MNATRWPYAALFFAYFAFVGIYSPYLSLYLEYRQFSAFEIGLLMSLLQVMRIVGPYAWGWLADQTHRPVGLLKISALCAIPAFAALSWGQTFALMFAVLVVLNLLTAAQVPLGESLAVRSLGGDFSGYGRLRLWGSVGFIIAVLVGGVVLDAAGLQWYPWLGVALLLGLWASIMVLPLPRGHGLRDRPVTDIRPVLRQRAVWWFFATAFLMIFAHAALYAYYSLYLAHYGYTSTAIGTLWALGVCAEIVFFFFQGTVLRRFALNTLLLFSFLICALRFFIIGAMPHSLVWLVLAQVLHAVTFGVHHSVTVAMLQRWFGAGLAARGQALYVAVGYGLGGSLGGLAAAYVWSAFGPPAAFIGAAAVAIVGAWVAVCLQREERKTECYSV